MVIHEVWLQMTSKLCSFLQNRNIFVLKQPSKRLLLAFEFSHLWLINFSLIPRFRSGFFGKGVLGTLKDMLFLSPEVR